MTLRHLPLMPKPRAMQFKDRTPYLIDEVQMARLELVQAYRKFFKLVGPSQAFRVIDQIKAAVALEDNVRS